MVIRMSVDPRHRDPLRGRTEPGQGRLQLGQGVVDVVVHDDHIEVVAVSPPEGF